MKKFIRYQILFSVIFAIALAIGVLCHSCEFAPLVIRSLFLTAIITFVLAIAIWGGHRRYNPAQFIASFMIAVFNALVGAFACYLIYDGWQNEELTFNLLIVGGTLLISSYITPNVIYSYLHQAKTVSRYLLVSFAQIMLCGLITWGALEWWFVHV